jgi:hypothetical protein
VSEDQTNNKRFGRTIYAPIVGASLTEDQLSAANEQFKTMSNDEMVQFWMEWTSIFL